MAADAPATAAATPSAAATTTAAAATITATTATSRWRIDTCDHAATAATGVSRYYFLVFSLPLCLPEVA
jgi:hypothetical protein